MNNRELDVLNILAENGEPMMAADITRKNEELTQSTVTAVLRNLLNDRLGVCHSKKNYDKRAALKDMQIKREISRALRAKEI